jgi:transcriptional regulator with XRE-family HTH domain
VGAEEPEAGNVMRRVHEDDGRIGARLRQRRIELGLSLQKISKVLGLSYQQLQKYEHGANRIAAVTLWRLSTILGVQPGYFFEFIKSNELHPRHKSSPASAGNGRKLTPLVEGCSEREALELLKVYNAIRDRHVRRQARRVLASLAQVQSGTAHK